MQQEKNISQIINVLREQLPLLSERYKVESLGLFGSYIHQRQGKGSDLDILVVFKETPGLLKFIELENYLSDLLEIKVDLVMKDALKPRIGQRILKEVVFV
ncbi:nucleotidyltransferase family protein [bacterium]|nr:nucleotidyltransferase family protein [bacterium]